MTNTQEVKLKRGDDTLERSDIENARKKIFSSRQSRGKRKVQRERENGDSMKRDGTATTPGRLA